MAKKPLPPGIRRLSESRPWEPLTVYAVLGCAAAVLVGLTFVGSIPPSPVDHPWKFPSDYVKEQNALLSGVPGTFYEKVVTDPAVVVVDGVFHMLFEAFDGNTAQIGRATSTDGVNFDVKGIALAPSEGYDSNGLKSPRLGYDAGSYFMTYVGDDGKTGSRICFALSSDMVNWTKAGVLLPSGVAWDANFKGEGVISPSKLVDMYAMYFAGRAVASAALSIGASTSSSYKSWTTELPNPIVKPGAAGSFSSHGVSPGAVFVDGRVAPGPILMYNALDDKDKEVSSWVLLSETGLVARESGGVLLESSLPFEKVGDVDSVRVTSAFTWGGKLWFYYGAAHQSVGLARIQIVQ